MFWEFWFDDMPMDMDMETEELYPCREPAGVPAREELDACVCAAAYEPDKLLRGRRSEVVG